MSVLDDDVQVGNPLMGGTHVVAQVRPVGADANDDTTAAAAAADRPAAPGSPLAAIRARVKAARATAGYKDLRIPGLGDPMVKWDADAVFVRYRALTGDEVNTIIDRNRPKDGWDFQWANSVQMLFAACEGMFSVDATGRPVGEPSTWPRFGHQMAVDAGLDIDGAGDAAGALLREFYVAEVDVVNAAEVVLTMSKRDGLTQERALPEG